MDTPGKRLKKLRNQMKLTQEKLGKKVGLAWYQVKDLESGKVEISQSIAKLLYYETGVNPDWLLTREEPMMKEERPLTVSEELALYNKVKGDLELSEIIELLKEQPQDKKLVLKLLKGKKDIKEALDGFQIKNLLEER